MNIKRPQIDSRQSAVSLYQASVQATVLCNIKIMMVPYSTSGVGIWANHDLGSQPVSDNSPKLGFTLLLLHSRPVVTIPSNTMLLSFGHYQITRENMKEQLAQSCQWQWKCYESKLM